MVYITFPLECGLLEDTLTYIPLLFLATRFFSDGAENALPCDHH